MTSELAKLLNPINRLDDVKHLMNAASLATADLGEYERSAISMVLEVATNMLASVRKELVELGGFDLDEPEAS